MDPNSTNQQWSQWTFIATHPQKIKIPFTVVKENVARFMRKGFGSTARMKVERDLIPSGDTRWRFTIQVEGANANDPDKRFYMQECVTTFLKIGFGPATSVVMEVRLLAGKPEDGRPADQWLIMPTLSPIVM